jgi:hypothetical protein
MEMLAKQAAVFSISIHKPYIIQIRRVYGHDLITCVRVLLAKCNVPPIFSNWMSEEKPKY